MCQVGAYKRSQQERARRQDKKHRKERPDFGVMEWPQAQHIYLEGH
jgi:hypothetical protein